MPFNRRRPMRRNRSSTRRKLVWADFPLDFTVGVGNFVSFDVLTAFRGASGSTTGATVTRIHARTWVTSAVVVGDGLSDAFIVDQIDEAQAAPGVAFATAHVLTPSAQPNADWMLYRQWNVHPHYSFNGAVDQWEADVRSRRKLNEIGDTLLYVFENRDASATVSVTTHIRTLLALP